MADKCVEFSIQLDSKQLVYYPGKHITGKVIVELSDPLKVQSLILKFRGEGYTSWTEKDGRGENCRLREFTEKKHFISEERYLLGSTRPSGENQVDLSAGRATYDFSFRLPSNSPSSFEGTFGHIRYELEGTLLTAVKEEDPVVTKKFFTVNEIIDANSELYMKDVGGEYSSNPSCLALTSVPVQFFVTLKRKCYTPGETILINAHVENHSKRDFKSITSILTQVTTYRVNQRDKTKVINKDIVTINGPSVLKGKTFEWNNEPMNIPATEPTISSCSVISVEYVLKIIVSVSMGSNPTLILPITIGTIPSVNYDEILNEKNSPITDFAEGEEYTPLLPSEFGYSKMTPPSYTGVVSAKDRIKGGLHTPIYTFAKPY